MNWSETMADTDDQAQEETGREAADLPGTSLNDQIAMLRKGWEPIPVEQRTKRPRYPWSNVEITEEWLRDVRADYANHTSTGFRTGRVSAWDYDLRSEDHTTIVREAAERCLGPSFFQRIGSKGVLTLYRNESPIAKITIKGRCTPKGKLETLVEVLGDGQQFVGYGYHPNGHPYSWPYDFIGCDPLSTKVDDLPKITPEQMRDGVAIICKTLRDLGYHNVQASELGIAGDEQAAKGAACGAPVTEKMLRDMLDHIQDPPRDEWLGICAGLKSANVVTENGERAEDFDGFGLFHEYSSKWCSYEGEADCRKLWNSLKPQSMKSGGAGLGMLVLYAKRGGYSGPTRYAHPGASCGGLSPCDVRISRGDQHSLRNG